MQVSTWQTLTWTCKFSQGLTSFYRVLQVLTRSCKFIQGLAIKKAFRHPSLDLARFQIVQVLTSDRVSEVFTGFYNSNIYYMVLQDLASFTILKVLSITLQAGVAGRSGKVGFSTCSNKSQKFLQGLTIQTLTLTYKIFQVFPKQLANMF